MVDSAVDFLVDLAGAHRAVTRDGQPELDLMARIAEMVLRERWSGWDREPFTDESRNHLSVWQKLADGGFGSQGGLIEGPMARTGPGTFRADGPKG